MTWVITGIVGGARVVLTPKGVASKQLARAHHWNDPSHAELHRHQLAYSGLLKDWSEIKIVPCQDQDQEQEPSSGRSPDH